MILNFYLFHDNFLIFKGEIYKMKNVKIIAIVVLVFIIAQLFSPKKNSGDIETIDFFLNETDPPEDVQVILKNTCFDCHSDHTVYPWYNTITPLNFWISEHINEGKKHFNMSQSQWSTASLKKKDHKFDELIEMIDTKEMPLKSYTWTHTEANLTDLQRQKIKAWAQKVRESYAAMTLTTN